MTPAVKDTGSLINFELYPNFIPLNWANTNNIEFVPMIQTRTFEYASNKQCTMDLKYKDKIKNKKIKKLCNIEEIINSLKKTQESFTTPMKFLIPWNEMYVKEIKNDKKGGKKDTK